MVGTPDYRYIYIYIYIYIYMAELHPRHASVPKQQDNSDLIIILNRNIFSVKIFLETSCGHKRFTKRLSTTRAQHQVYNPLADTSLNYVYQSERPFHNHLVTTCAERHV